MKKAMIILFALTAISVAAQEKLQPVVSVTGEGIVKVVPDRVTVRMSVENTGDDPVQLKNINDTAVDAVLKHIRQSGIDAKDVQTQHVNLSRRYDYNTKTYSYQATQTITVLLKDLKKYDVFITGLMQKGINRIDGIVFSASNEEELKSQARKKAVSDAKMKAVEYAGVLNQQIGKAIQISEQGSYSPPPMPMYRAENMALASDGGTRETLAVGEMEITTKIQVVFELQ